MLDYLDYKEISTKEYEFYWKVSANGYSLFDDIHFRSSPYIPYERDWIFRQDDWDRIDRRLPLIVANRVKKGQPIPEKIYKPLSNLCLHRKFASLKTERLEEEAINFANKFGLLAQPVWLTGPEHEHHNEIIMPYIFGESLFRWRRSIDQMGVMLTIWDLVRNEEAGKLGQIILWPSSDTVKVRFKWESQKGRYEISAWGRDGEDTDWNYGVVEEVLSNYEEPHSHFAQFKKGDAIGPARYYLSRVLNYHLQGVTPHLVSMTGYEVAFMPETLLDALWLMFMLEVQGKTKTARCEYCGEWFDFERSSKQYCDNNHRRLAFYHRKKAEKEKGAAQ